MKVKIGVAQPRGFFGEEAKKHTEIALNYIDEGAKQGVKILCFPEGFPGPFTFPLPDIDFSAVCAKTKERGLYVIAGGLVQGEGANSYYTAERLIGPDGRIVGTYKRTTSAGPNIYEKLFMWGDRKLLWGDELPVFETEYGNIGILCCSEVYTPELARVLALEGADIIFFPAGGLFWTVEETWRNLIWARAIENIVYTAVCSHIFGAEDGIAMIASPEEILAESKKEGMITAEIDLNRTAWLRNTDFPATPFLMRTAPGKSSGLSFFSYKGQSISRRPELYKTICMDEKELKAVSKRK